MNMDINMLLGIVSIFIAIVGILLSIIFYIKTIKKRIPMYCSREMDIVKGSINNVRDAEIFVKGIQIQNLSLNEVALWNAGREAIKFSDMAKCDKLRIELEGDGMFIDFDIVQTINKANNFNLKKVSDNVIEIEFDYFDFKEGLVFKAYYTTFSGKCCAKVKGAFVGSKCVSVKQYIIYENVFERIISSNLSQKRIRIIGGLILLIMPFLFIIDTIVYDNFGSEFYQSLISLNKIILYPISILLALLFLNLGFRVLMQRVPKEFIFFEKDK